MTFLGLIIYYFYSNTSEFNRDNFVNYFYFFGLGIIFLMGIIYFFYFIKKKKLLFKRLTLHNQIHNIVMISLFSAIATVVLIFFSKINNITLIPNVRVAFEGVLVKLSGFLFGPIVGLISAFVTELVVIIFIPTYFHYKYLLVLMAFGFFAGLIKIFRQNHLKDWLAIIVLYLGIICFFTLTLFFFFYDINKTIPIQNTDQWIDNINRQFIKTFNLKTLIFWLNVLLFFILIIAITFIFFNRSKTTFFLREIDRNRHAIISVLCLTLFSEYLISVFIATGANRSVFGENPGNSELLFISAVSFAPIKIFINTTIILSVYRVLIMYKPNLKFTY